MPSYIDNNLLLNEKVIYRSQPHWIVFGPALIWLVIAIIFLYLRDPLLVPLGYLALFITIYQGLRATILFLTTEYGITNKRVLVKFGFIRRTILEIVLRRIEGVQVEQSVLGRLLGYGTVIICGTGGTRDPVYRVVDPLRFHRIVQEQVAAEQEQRIKEGS